MNEFIQEHWKILYFIPPALYWTYEFAKIFAAWWNWNIHPLAACEATDRGDPAFKFFLLFYFVAAVILWPVGFWLFCFQWFDRLRIARLKRLGRWKE